VQPQDISAPAESQVQHILHEWKVHSALSPYHPLVSPPLCYLPVIFVSLPTPGADVLFRMPLMPSADCGLWRRIACILQALQVIQDHAFVLVRAESASSHGFANNWGNFGRPIVRWVPGNVFPEVDSSSEFFGTLLASEDGF
jgi:hypothetical protein